MAETACAAVAGNALVPISSQHQSGNGKWHPVTLTTGLLIQGGYSKIRTVATTIDYTIGEETHQYVEIEKNIKWFLSAVGADKKGDLKNVHVFDEMRRRRGLMDADTAVAADTPTAAAEQADDDDPMNNLDCVMEPSIQLTKLGLPRGSSKKARAKANAQYRAKAQVFEVAMPTRPPCVRGFTQSSQHLLGGDTTSVWLYMPPETPTKTDPGKKHKHRNMWMRIGSLNWLLSYAADELHHQGIIPCTGAGAPHPQSKIANVPAVADARLQWDFHGNGWAASFVAGEFVGHARTFLVADLTERQWNKMRSHTPPMADVLWCKACLFERKNALKSFCIQWCDAVTRNECDKFDTDWDVTVLETPMKRKRDNHEDILVEDADDANQHDGGHESEDAYGEDGGNDSEEGGP
jgi:hypothetical protein